MPLRSPRPVMALIATGTVAIAVGLAALPAFATAASAATASVSAVSASAGNVRQSEWWLTTLGVNGAWITSQGSGVTVAVLSDGVYPSQPDLAGAVTAAPALPAAPTATGLYFGEQGTPIASLIAGQGHGSGGQAGIIGVAPQAKILSIPVTLPADDPQLSQATVAAAIPAAIAAGIKYAVNHGATVIDLPIDPGQPGSSGTGGMPAAAGGSAAEQAAVNYALAHNVVLVAPAGDDATGSDAANYPAAYHGVIAVGAFNKAFAKAPWSSHQAYVTVTAAGAGVLAATSAGYATMNSTSAASAVVTGIVALIRSRYPHLSVDAIRQALITTTIYHRAQGLANGSGYGTVNAGGALAAAALLAAPASERAGARAQPRRAPASLPSSSPTHSIGAQLVHAGELSGGLLALLLLLIAGYAVIGRRRPARQQPVVATEWTRRQAQSRYPIARGAGADRMLEFFASPTVEPERPALPARRAQADLGVFAAVAGRQAAAIEAAGRSASSQPGDVIQPASVIHPGGVIPASAEMADGGNWADHSPASRAVSRRPSVSGTPPWEPASPPNSELPWTAAPGRHSAGGQSARPAALPSRDVRSDESDDPSPFSSAGAARWGEPPAGSAPAAWSGSTARNQADQPSTARPATAHSAAWNDQPAPTGQPAAPWDQPAASIQPAAPWDQPAATTQRSPWEQPAAMSPSGAWGDQPSAAWAQESRIGRQQDWRASADLPGQQGQDESGTSGPDWLGQQGPSGAGSYPPAPPRIASSGLPVRQPRASAATPLSPSGSLWEPVNSQPTDYGSDAQDRTERPIYTWDPKASAENFPPPAAESRETFGEWGRSE